MRVKRAWRHLPQWQREGIREFDPAEWHLVPKEENTGIGYLPFATRQYISWLHSQDLFRCPQTWKYFA